MTVLLTIDPKRGSKTSIGRPNLGKVGSKTRTRRDLVNQDLRPGPRRCLVSDDQLIRRLIHCCLDHPAFSDGPLGLGRDNNVRHIFTSIVEVH